MKTTTQWENQHGETVTTWTGAVNAREQKIVELRRQKALDDIKRSNAREDRLQHSTKAKKKRTRGGVKDSIDKEVKIARNKERWINMNKRHKTANTKPETVPNRDETKKGGDVVRKSKESKNEQAKTLKRKLPGREPPKTTRHDGVMEGGDGEGGGEEPSRGRQVVTNEKGRDKNRTAKGRGSSAKEKRMEDYFTRKPRKKRKDGT